MLPATTWLILVNILVDSDCNKGSEGSADCNAGDGDSGDCNAIKVLMIAMMVMEVLVIRMLICFTISLKCIPRKWQSEYSSQLPFKEKK